MKRLVAVSIFLTSSFAHAQEVITCAKDMSSPQCISGSSVSSFIPSTKIPDVSKIIVPKNSGTDLTIRTEPHSKPHTYWVSVENDSVIDLRADLSSKLPSQGSFDTPPDASNMVLLVGHVNSLDLNISGFKGRDATSFGVKCAADITAGKFGEGAALNFVNRRQANPNIPQDRCDSEDLRWISLNTRDSFCPTGTSDIRSDNAANPSFDLRRLAYKNNCLHQEDIRQCEVSGLKKRCTIKYIRHHMGECKGTTGLGNCDGFSIAVTYGNNPATDVRSLGSHPVRLLSSTVRGLGGNPRCEGLWCEGYIETYEVTSIVEVTDSDFYQKPSITTDSDAITKFCSGYLDTYTEVELFYRAKPGQAIAEDKWEKNSTGAFNLNTIATIFEYRSTTNKLCSVNSLESYVGRNVLEVTRETNLSPKRQYQYSSTVCPAGWSIASVDQLHFKPEWSETIPCTKDNCPNASLSYRKDSQSLQTMALDRGQTGADRGRAFVFAYEINYPTISAKTGGDGKSASVNIDIPSTTKYCASYKDLSNTPANSDTALKPSVTLHEVSLKAYSTTLPDPIPNRVYNLSTQANVYKRVDSSVRDWIARLPSN